MSLLQALFLVLAAGQPQADSGQHAAETALCPGEVTSVYLPERETALAPNISLAQFQYRTEGDSCGQHNISHDELMRLFAASNALTTATFSASEKTFVLFVKYALSPSGPATLEMRASIPQTGNEELGHYYDKAEKLTDFHSSKGPVEVFFRYEVSRSSVKGETHSGGAEG